MQRSSGRSPRYGFRGRYLVISVLLAALAGYGAAATVGSPQPAKATVFGVGPFNEPPDCAWLGGDPATPMRPYSGETMCSPVPVGQRVGVFEAPASGAQRFNEEVARVAFRIAGTDRYRVGPVLMTFPNESGGVRPTIAYGDGSIWLYDCATEHGSEVLRISTSTGEVIQRSPMPDFSRPIVAVNAEGFWMGPDNDSGWNLPAPTFGIYVVPLGASHPILVKATRDFVAAMDGTTDSMNVVVEAFNGAPRLTYRFSGLIR